MTDYDKVAETIQRVCDRGVVTMNRPLGPWGAPPLFYRVLADHMDAATHKAFGKGLLHEDEGSPLVWYSICGLLLLVFGFIVWRFV